ncbi:DUF4893 domain-containing protein [Tistrella mobilis]|uniref:DUF4893 domain-containing protein n=1 Tax=Tistrella mobilis TaxID=171437 RepID=UPI003558971D
MMPLNARKAVPVALAAMLAIATTALPARADGVFPTSLTTLDQQRLEAFDTARAEAVAEARAGGSPEDVSVLDEVLSGRPTTMEPAEMVGIWRCRTIKLGGLLPLTVYRDFKCRITDDGAGLRLEKLTGSQRTGGTFYDLADKTRLGYAGAGWVAGEAPARYDTETERNQVGYLVVLGPERMRLELPLPQFESKFDILELRR